jgi:serine/threonine protein kinase
MRIAKKYELIGVLGKGTFGSVYQGKHVKTGELVAVKLEKNDQSRVLKHETTILNYLYSKSCRNIPPVHMYGIVDVYAYLVMPFYEENFASFIQSKPTRCALSLFFSSAIRILGNIHKHGVVHRDIKPDNWMIRGNQLVLIDFGLATFYIDDQGKHLPLSQKTSIVGTPKYVSVRIHEGCEYSRRDDLISLAYIGMYIAFKDEFDWNTPFREMSLDVSHESNAYLRQAKQLDPVLSRIPDTFVELSKYIESVYSLGFEETPDYDQLANLFSQTQSAENDINDTIGGKV